MKKIFYYLLICTIVISTLSLSGNLSVSAASDSEGFYSEAFEIDGVQYFYEDTKSYTLTITKALNGEEIIAYKDKNGKEDEIYTQHKPGITKSDIEQTVTSEKNMEIISLNSIDVKEIENIKERVLNNEINLEKQTIQDFATVTNLTESESENSSLPSAGISSVSKVNHSLAQVYGAQFTNKYLTGTYKDGVAATLNQHMTFGASRNSSFLFNALAAIGIVATAVGTPVSGLLGIASWTSAAAGAYTLDFKSEFVTYNAKVYLQKEVKVDNVYPYRSFYDRGLTAVTGTQGYASLSSVNSTYKSNDYDSNSSILNTGIEYYLKYH